MSDLKDRAPFSNERLFCPGPTPVPASAHIASMQKSVYHRTEEFYETFNNCQKMLAPFMGMSKSVPMILTASGTGAMEAAVTHLTSAGDQVSVIVGGKFGERWQKINDAYGNKTDVFNVIPGSSPEPAVIVRRLLELKEVKAFFIQANETSTGVAYPLEAICRAIRAAPSLSHMFIVVDAISALCAHPVELEEWGIDCVIGGSQKGFGVPPGLAFIGFSERGLDFDSKRPRFYFDLRREWKTQSHGETAWTPASTLIQSLQVALSELHQIGKSRVLAHHKLMAEATQSATHALGLELFARHHWSNALTAIKVPAGIDGKKLIKHMQIRYGAIMAGGQDELVGKIVRLSHLGFADRFQILTGIATLEFALADLGMSIELGKGVSAAMRVMHSK
jgi:aspartate aminotransferase-like enzyme